MQVNDTVFGVALGWALMSNSLFLDFENKWARVAQWAVMVLMLLCSVWFN